jgi:hypothetical protein
VAGAAKSSWEDTKPCIWVNTQNCIYPQEYRIEEPDGAGRAPQQRGVDLTYRTSFHGFRLRPGCGWPYRRDGTEAHSGVAERPRGCEMVPRSSAPADRPASVEQRYLADAPLGRRGTAAAARRRFDIQNFISRISLAARVPLALPTGRRGSAFRGHRTSQGLRNGPAKFCPSQPPSRYGAEAPADAPLGPRSPRHSKTHAERPSRAQLPAPPPPAARGAPCVSRLEGVGIAVRARRAP